MLIFRTKKSFALGVATLAVMMFGLLIFGKAGTALADQPYDASNLISDTFFSESQIMSVSDIQTFLNNENSGIKNLSDTEACSPTIPTSPDPWASSYYPHCGETESSAQIIYDAAQAYDISPRVIMATMQKEESLITDPTPWQNNSGAVDCAMGYLSCGTVSGFFNQVDNGTWQLRTDIQLMTGQSWWGYSPSSYPCKSAGYITAYNSSGQSVSMRAYSTGLYPGANVIFDNPAVYNSSGGLVGGKNPTVPETFTIADSSTAALYCYTPYVGPYSTTGYSGSYNFVQSYEQWWGSTIGDLVMVPGGGVYKLENGTKRAFPNEIVFSSYSYSLSSVETISSFELSQIPDGSAMPYNVHFRDGHLVSSSGGGVYDVSGGTKLPFPNEITLSSYSLTSSNAIPISNTELSYIPDGAAMPYNVHYRDGHLVSSPSGGVYDVVSGQKRPFPDQATFLSYGYKWSDALVISNLELSLIPDGAAMPPKT